MYDSRMEELKNWMNVANQKLSQCAQPVKDQGSLEEKRALVQVSPFLQNKFDLTLFTCPFHMKLMYIHTCYLQMLFTEKDHGHQKLMSTLESGEKLSPDTAAVGREKVRGELRGAKQEWEDFLAGLNDAQRHVDSYMHQWSSYTDGQDQMLRWMAETEAALRADVELKNTLQEKRVQLQAQRVSFLKYSFFIL